MSAMPEKVAPPLKSARTKLRISEECVIASASTRVRSSSDLPEPVAPTHRPCGPMPSSAASLMSRYTCSPLAPTPSGTRIRSCWARWRQLRVTSKEPGSPEPIMSVKSRLDSSGSSSPPAETRYGASWRASASDCQVESRSGLPLYVAPEAERSTSSSELTVTIRCPLGSSTSPGTTSMTVTPWTPSGLASIESCGTPAPSMITTRWGWSAAGAESRMNRWRPDSSSCSRYSRSPRSVANSRREPAPSASLRCWLCGSHLAQSHSSAAPGAAATATIRSSGECRVVNWAIIARTLPYTESGSPHTVMW